MSFSKAHAVAKWKEDRKGKAGGRRGGGAAQQVERRGGRGNIQKVEFRAVP